jgi:two-component system response regulator QseB
MRILLIEDDRPLGQTMTEALRAEHYAVDWSTDGSAADTALRTTNYDALLLDLGLPGEDGLIWLERWRSRGIKVPVLVLTARDAIEQRVRGLDRGADDYLIKPIALVELLARLRAAMRRAGGRSEALWSQGPLSFDPARRTVNWAGDPVDLTAKEIAILEILLSRPGQILSRRQLTERLYGWDQAEPEGNAIEVHIHHLRRKLDPRLIRTIRGLGYRLENLEASD